MCNLFALQFSPLSGDKLICTQTGFAGCGRGCGGRAGGGGQGRPRWALSGGTTGSEAVLRGAAPSGLCLCIEAPAAHLSPCGGPGRTQKVTLPGLQLRN